MLQFYFLSVLLNCITGLILITNTDNGKAIVVNGTNLSDKAPAMFQNKTFKLVIGILTCFTALIKLLTAFPGSILILGDLLPSLAGIIGGVALLLEFYLSQDNVESKINPKLEALFITNKKYIGIICVAVALLHFLFPKVIII